MTFYDHAKKHKGNVVEVIAAIVNRSSKFRRRRRSIAKKLTRMAFRHERLEDRRLLATIPINDVVVWGQPDVSSFEATRVEMHSVGSVEEVPSWSQADGALQPHFLGSPRLLAASSDPTLGDLPYDPIGAEERLRSVAERVADNPHYRVDDSGNILAINPFTAPPDSKGDDTQEIEKMNPFPAQETFFLNSLPGATKTIYLDFNGHSTSGTLWNSQFFGGSSLTTTAFNFEGDGNSFTNNELFRIQRIWERVAEDFLPFNVNVTTQEPPLSSLIRSGGSDTQWGVRVVIGPGSWLSGAGGVAYLNSFNWSSDTPCFVFSNALSNSEKSIAEAVSHEIGHTLGLEHDGQGTSEYYSGHGSGATGWAPIMGVGYSRELVQWSRGEYSNATQTQNDLSVITTQNGFGYRTDDHGSTTATATPLNVVNSTALDDGIIERNTDRDFFSFSTSGGNVNIIVSPFYRSPNLDILATLYNSSGTVISTSNPTTALNASFSLSLAAGNYFVSIEGTGKPASGSDQGYSNYGSLGYYSIQAVIPQDPGSLVASLAGGNLTIQDSAGDPNQITLEISGSDLVITDLVEKFNTVPAGTTLSNDDRTLTVPLASITNSVILDLGAGDDTIQLGFWFGSLVPGLTVLNSPGTDSVNFQSSFFPETNRNISVSAESVSVASGASLFVTGSGTLTILSDSLTIASDANLVSGVTPITIAPQSAGRAINLGTKVAGQLGITNTEFNRITASTVVIGNGSSGGVTVSSGLTRTSSTNVELRSGADINLNASLNTGGGGLLLAPGASPSGVRPKASGLDATASTVSFASDLVLEINGSVADVTYDRLNVSGTVNLTGVDLVIAGSFPGITGNETFDIVSATSLVGQFTGLPNQSQILVHGKSFVVNYTANGVQLVPAIANSTIQQSYIYHAGSSFTAGGIAAALDNSKSMAKAGPLPIELTLNNLINSSRGVNGLVFDFEGLPVTSLAAADFEFRMSPQGAFASSSHPPGSWQLAPAPASITVLPGALDRVALQWPGNAIANRWLRVTVRANSNTGLAAPETYYVGHLLGETTGPVSGVYTVAFADITPIRSAIGQIAGVGSANDIDKNGTVAFADISAMRASVGAQLTNITIPGETGGGALLMSPGLGGTGDDNKLKSSAVPAIEPLSPPASGFFLQSAERAREVLQYSLPNATQVLGSSPLSGLTDRYIQRTTNVEHGRLTQVWNKQQADSVLESHDSLIVEFVDESVSAIVTNDATHRNSLGPEVSVDHFFGLLGS
jgi:hypothetical protein